LLAVLSVSAYAEFGNISVARAQGSIVEYCSYDVPKDILDEQTIDSTLTVSDVGDIADLNVKINIDHMWISDLLVSLIAPDGTVVDLFSTAGRSAGSFDDTILDDEASLSISSGSSPFNGVYKPEGHLSSFYGKSMQGTWKLQVTDTAAPDTGMLNSWCIIIEKKPYESMEPPVIHSEPGVPDGICNKLAWEVPVINREFHSEYGGSIPNYGNKRYAIDIDDPNVIEDLNVKLNLTHGKNSELQVYLVSPDMTRIKLFSGVGDDSQDFINTILDSDAQLSIDEGTGPFTGHFRPEGNLGSLIGTNIRGRWALEITDSGWDSTGVLESWSLIADLTDISYFVQCASSASFSNIIEDSGWITGNSYTFTELDPQQNYWYRVKARPLMRWFQTTRSDFEMNILSDIIATEDCNVELPVADRSGGSDMEFHVIKDPSFESGWGWAVSYISNVDVGVYSKENTWASDGNWSLGVEFDHSNLSFYDDYARIYQTVDFTDVDTLMFDYACYGYAESTLISVEIGDFTAWYEYGIDDLNDIHPTCNEIVDVSSYSGPQELSLKVKSDLFGWFDAYVFWDNLRTYRTIPQEILPGAIISTPMSINDDQTWDVVNYNATIPSGTSLTVDVLPKNGSNPIPGYSDIPDGADISNISHKTIRLRANLSTNRRHVTPSLHEWSVYYKNAAFESDWSNVVSSQCN
jgi:subtilisin-like proprotein convertase family protein